MLSQILKSEQKASFNQKLCGALLVAGSAFAFSAPTQAGLQEGDMMGKIGIQYIIPEETSVKLGNSPKAKLKKDDDPIAFSVDFLLMASDELGVNLGGTFPAKIKQKVEYPGGNGSYEYKMIPLHATLQYYFLTPQDDFRPYIGAGLHYTDLKDFKIDHHKVEKLELDKTYGFLFQFGGVFDISDNLFIDASARYMFLEPDGKARIKLEKGDHTAKPKVKDYKINPWLLNASIGIKF